MHRHGFWREIGVAYHVRIVDAGKEQAFWILVSFLVTFLMVRLGRRSIDIVITAATLAALVVLGFGFWRDAVHAIGRHV
jgi:hypothetical protein